ncbi:MULTISPECIES: hypothetical protein [Alphaproteobacteria]|jgi:hypothetical protein|uniref:hypothetical protein n=1 Tax=Alphaproteobacteria TaxID=28211 RepID=UPI00036BFD0D|nr:hypothetical protein [Komagataeibacter europaeus]GBQ50905.1 hypothetical protein AA18890_3381 [Komagataeibacter europaeus LMG 18890]
MKPLNEQSLPELQRHLAHIGKVEREVNANIQQTPAADYSFVLNLLQRGREELTAEIERR